MGWLEGLVALFTLTNLVALFAGTLFGMVIGALPGLGAAFAMALFLPATFMLQADTALVFMGALYASAVFGGTITAILVNTPGTVGSVATTFDGYPLAKQGRGAYAVGAAALGSVVGGLVGVVGLIFVTPIISSIALQISPAVLFALALLGISLVAFTGQGSTLIGIVLAAVGVLISLIGQDGLTGRLRYTFGIDALDGGVSFAAVIIGLFAVAQAFVLAEKDAAVAKHGLAQDSVLSGVIAALKHPVTLLRSSVLGVVIGAVPGVGISISNMVSYFLERTLSPKPETYGKGNIAGVVAPEAANNATVLGELIPALSLGIPGGAASAIFLAAVTLHGITPGPEFFSAATAVHRTVFVGMVFSQLLFFILGILLLRAIVQITRVPSRYLWLTVIVLSMMGSYGLNASYVEVVIALAFGAVGYVLQRARLSSAPLVLGVILGPLIEENFRRSLLISNGSWTVFFGGTSLVLYAVILVTVSFPYIQPLIRKRRNHRLQASS